MWSSLVKTDWLTGSYFELPSVRLLNYFELCVDGFEPSGGTLYFWKCTVRSTARSTHLPYSRHEYGSYSLHDCE
jgi:hypothetical protein